ncbi:MAG: hypothetical protein ABH822_01930 [Patescibacteria group bacterium]
MNVFKDKILLSAFGASLFILLIGFSVAFVALADVRHLLVIHFDSYSGIDFLGDKSDVFGALLSGLALTIINGLLAIAFYLRERLLSYILAFSSILVSLLILITIFVIVSVN